MHGVHEGFVSRNVHLSVEEGLGGKWTGGLDGWLLLMMMMMMMNYHNLFSHVN